MDKTKSFNISKHVVFQAYKLVKKNKGSAGVDGQTIKHFEEKLKDNLFKIWNRMSSGSYFPPPVKVVEIPKKNGGTRILGVPSIGDRIAQMTAKLYFEPLVEPHFDDNSYGYRPGKSALDAVGITRRRCWSYNWVLEFDIKGMFDNIDHKLLMKAVKKHTNHKWLILYIRRWLKAPFQYENGRVVERNSGTPQGGVISPVLANLFMHYAFDKWINRMYSNNPWSRYADDAVIHCKTADEAQAIKRTLEQRLNACGLELHPDKTRVVYCKDTNRIEEHNNIQFTFLGYTFRPRKAVNRKTREVFTSFLPAISNKSKKHIRQTIKKWHLLWMTNKNLDQIAEKYNSIIRGWLNYYGRYGRGELKTVLTHINYHLLHWIRRKYKKCKYKPQKAQEYLVKMANESKNLFAHWRVGILPTTG